MNWVNERLVIVEDASAGMVWAPEAIWDPAKGKHQPSHGRNSNLTVAGQYLVHWASKFVRTPFALHPYQTALTGALVSRVGPPTHGLPIQHPHSICLH